MRVTADCIISASVPIDAGSSGLIPTALASRSIATDRCCSGAQRVERRDLRDLFAAGPGSVQPDRADGLVHGSPGSIAVLGERQLRNLERIGHLSRRRAA